MHVLMRFQNGCLCCILFWRQTKRWGSIVCTFRVRFSGRGDLVRLKLRERSGTVHSKFHPARHFLPNSPYILTITLRDCALQYFCRFGCHKLSFPVWPAFF